MKNQYEMFAMMSACLKTCSFSHS